MYNLFIFHNDLRLKDNTGLEASCKKEKTIPIFIFTPTQVGNNQYKSNRAVKFMCDCLESLNKDLGKFNSKLFVFYGNTHQVVKEICKNIDIKAIYFNENYTPFSINRDEKLIKNVNVEVFSSLDYSLWEMGSSRNGEIYKKYTPYYNKVKNNKVEKVSKYTCNNFVSSSFKIKNTINIKDISKNYKEKNEVFLPGRKEGKKTLNNIKSNYGKTRNILIENTTLMSAHIKFGTISIREVYWKIKQKGDTDLLKQIIWREFYMNILWKYPYVILGKNKNFKQKYSKVGWKRGQNGLFSKWKNGKTGFPIVDACMKELNETGYIHNRGRLIVADFLVKLMGWHWEEGEKYFATKLIDYDIANNNGNWQFVAGSGTDSQPYYRIMNPSRQNERFDPQCEYIKHWLPELKEVEPKHLYNWGDYYMNYKVNYPKPILNYIDSREKILKKYKSIF